jgi:hydroxymethylpyrimidine/phosphomethylpyrimidine kinase
MRAPGVKATKGNVCVLAIGGLDPGGGAGILADARAIGHAGAFACSAVALLTVQATSGLRSATPVPARDLAAQCKEVLRVQRVGAIKVGALGSLENVQAASDVLAIHRDLPAVVDTVMLPTRGRSRLLDERAVAALRERLVRRATVVTANAPEAAVLTGGRVTRLDEARDAAVAILELGPQAVLVKGGHLSGDQAIDLLAVRGPKVGQPRVRVVELRSPRLRLPAVHGGGCALASLIAARLALTSNGEPAIVESVRWAKKAHHGALQRLTDVGGDMRILFG